MAQLAAFPISDLAAKAGEAAALMKALSNERRLLILCNLISEGELAVGALATRVSLSQSALSQHLARLRDEGLVAYRREAQTLFYRVADPRAEQVLDLLQRIYCPELRPASGQTPIAAPPARADNEDEGKEKRHV